jgi:hypothetical protein
MPFAAYLGRARHRAAASGHKREYLYLSGLADGGENPTLSATKQQQRKSSSKSSGSKTADGA